MAERDLLGKAERRSEMREALGASGLLTIAGIVTALGNVVFHTVVARGGGASAYGATGALLSLATVATFVGAGIQYAIARTTSLSTADPATILRHGRGALMPWLLLSLLLMPFSGLIAGYIQLDSALPVALSIVYFAIMVAWTIPTGVLLGRRRYMQITLLAVFIAVLRLVLGALFSRTPDPTLGAVLASVLAAAIYAAVATVAALRCGSGDAIAGEPASDTGLVGEGVVSSALAAALWVVWSLPIAFSRHALNAVSAGDFAAAQLLAGGILLTSASLTSAFFPSIASGRQLRTIAAGFAATATIAIVGIIALTAAGPAVLPHFYGRQFNGTAQDFAVLGVSATAVAMMTYVLWVMRALDRSIGALAAGIAATLAVEILAGAVWHGSQNQLAAGPALAVVAGSVVAWSVGLRQTQLRRRARRIEVRGVPVAYRAPQGAGNGADSLLGVTGVGMMVHNESASIETCMRAVLSERDGHVGVASLTVVASDCSDDTVDIVRRLASEDARVRLLVEAGRSGKAAAINWFLRETTEPICVVLGGDTLLAPGGLSNLVAGLREPGVGMTGPRIVPVDTANRVVGKVIHLLWEFHHRVALSHPKLGEAVAFRRVFQSLDPSSLVDEVSIEALMQQSGQRLKYVPEAVVFNHGAQNVHDYLAHRSRIHLGHLVTRFKTGYSASTLRLRPAFAATFRVVASRPASLPYVAVAVGLEMVARWRADLAFLINGTRVDGVWRPIESAKRPFTSAEVPSEVPIGIAAGAEQVA